MQISELGRSALVLLRFEGTRVPGTLSVGCNHPTKPREQQQRSANLISMLISCTKWSQFRQKGQTQHLRAAPISCLKSSAQQPLPLQAPESPVHWPGRP